MHVQQVRDLLKGTLAFRGSTMETECDFMEIDNNIAARLQIPSLQQQKEKDSGLPEGLPVPMLANFGHFENSDENESSFMSGDGGEEQRGESTGSDEQTKGNDECGLTATETTENDQKQMVEELENLNTEITSVKQEDNGEYPKQNIAVCGGAVKDDSKDLFASFGDGPGNVESILSNPLFCGEIQANDSEQRIHVDNSNTATLFGSNAECRIDNETGQLDNQRSVLHGHKGTVVDTSTSSETDPLFNPPEAKATNPLNERRNPNDISAEQLSGAESLDPDFVFVNRDGTAEGEPRPPRHPLETSDEF